MGSGRWSTDVYTTGASVRAATGASAFAYDADVKRSTPRSAWKVHPTLDVRGVAMRESRDSTEHPESLAIAVLFDVTGSMGSVPRTLQESFPDLFGLLLRKGYVEHPQIMFGGIGDATCDRAPLQLGQFESDNRMDDHLGNILLEGGGGGQMSESYELAMYYLARHSALDCVEKRGRKGYLFIIGDELAYTHVKAREVQAVLGEEIGENIPLANIVTELQRLYEVFYILPAGSSYAGSDEVLNFWRGLLRQNVLELDDLGAVCETIALTIGLGEGSIDLDEGLEHLREIGSEAGESVERALALVGAGRVSTSPTPTGVGTTTASVTRL